MSAPEHVPSVALGQAGKHHAECSCGWCGMDRSKKDAAQRDGIWHMKNPKGGRPPT